jgi:hypothetical protein
MCSFSSNKDISGTFQHVTSDVVFCRQPCAVDFFAYRQFRPYWSKRKGWLKGILGGNEMALNYFWSLSGKSRGVVFFSAFPHEHVSTVCALATRTPCYACMLIGVGELHF